MRSIADSLDSSMANCEHVLQLLLGYDAALGRVPDEILIQVSRSDICGVSMYGGSVMG